MRRIVTGPEDPKLIALSEKDYAVAFSSLPPPSLNANGPDCYQNLNATVQMFLAKNGARLLDGGSSGGVRVDCGKTRIHEKNWISFLWKGQLMYVYSVYPHTILQARPADGVCIKRW